MKVLAIPGHNEYSIDGLGATRFQVPGRRSKEGDESLRCRTRAGDDWPNVVMEIGVSERIIQLQRDARWWLESSAGRTRLVIILHVTPDPHSLHIEAWRLQPNPNPRGRRPRAEIPMCINTIEIDAGGTVQPPMANLTIPYNCLFDDPHPNAVDIVFSAPELSTIALNLFGASEPVIVRRGSIMGYQFWRFSMGS
ncbi:hypothetical protein EV426DRAFT_581063 [Tirmania nivea]|nr:hypothetical protein EV426DRAFT_581063 [Tirmania nivea]